MATTFFLRSSASTATVTGFAGTKKEALLTRGAASTTQTDSTLAGLTGDGFAAQPWGDTAARDLGSTVGSGLIFITNPLDAFTWNSTMTASLRVSESSTMANYSPGCWVGRLTASGTLTQLSRSSSTLECGTTDAAMTVSVGSGGSISISAGDRLVFIPYWAAGGGGSTASGFTAAGTYSGPTASAAGDSFVTFTETITEQAAGGATSLVVPRRNRHLWTGR